MRTHDFTLRLQLAEPDSEPGEFIDALAAAGCDDATVGVGRHGYIALRFTREASTDSDAIDSAVRDVKRAIPTARLIDTTGA